MSWLAAETVLQKFDFLSIYNHTRSLDLCTVAFAKDSDISYTRLMSEAGNHGMIIRLCSLSSTGLQTAKDQDWTTYRDCYGIAKDSDINYTRLMSSQAETVVFKA